MTSKFWSQVRAIEANKPGPDCHPKCYYSTRLGRVYHDWHCDGMAKLLRGNPVKREQSPEEVEYEMAHRDDADDDYMGEETL